MKDVSRHYDILTPQERLVLTIEALARGDSDDSNKLIESCPKERCTMNDSGFSMAYSRLMDIALINLVDAYQALARANLAIGVVAGGRDDKWAYYFHHKTNQLSIQEAWKRFCDSINLDGNKVFAAFGLDVTDLQRPPLDEHIVADEEAVAILLDGMVSSWACPM